MSRKDKPKTVRVEVEDGAQEAPSHATPATQAAEDEASRTVKADTYAGKGPEETGQTGANGSEYAEAGNSVPTDDTRLDSEQDAVETSHPKQGSSAVTGQPSSSETPELQLLEAERDALRAELAELTEKLEKADSAATAATEKQLRIQADWENFRRRTAQERLAERQLATERLVSNLLPVIDDMERAIEHAGDQTGDENLTQFADGVAAVRAKMLNILKHEGVEMIDPVGEAFDPLAHQAVGRIEDKASFEDTVAQVFQKGYRMAGKIIRPAMVTVSFGGQKRPQEEAGSNAEAKAESDTEAKAESSAETKANPQTGQE